MSGGGQDALTDADSIAFCALLQAQGALGPAQQSPGQEKFWAFYGAIDSIAYDHYRFITNAQVKDWTDTLFAAMYETQTCYGISAAGMYVLYEYSQFAGCCFENGSFYPKSVCGHNGFPTDFAQRGGREPTWDGSIGLPSVSPWDWFATATGLWKPPGSPDQFFNVLNQSVNTLNTALQAAGKPIAAVTFFDNNCDTGVVQQYQQSRFDPKNWTDSQIFVQNLADCGIWAAQSQAVTVLLKPDTQTADMYVCLLHLLIGLGTSTQADQRFAQTIVTTIASSPGYPNDTFINQLVYLTLMYLADPMGSFGWNNAQLLARMHLFAETICSQDPASQAIQASLVRHQRVLQTDSAYPMQDPYCPSIGFTQRKSDTLFALDKARRTISRPAANK